MISAATSGSQGVDLVFLKVGDDLKEIAGLRAAVRANMHIRIAGTSLDKGVELDALAALPEEQRASLGMHQLTATELVRAFSASCSLRREAPASSALQGNRKNIGARKGAPVLIIANLLSSGCGRARPSSRRNRSPRPGRYPSEPAWLAARNHLRTARTITKSRSVGVRLCDSGCGHS